MATRNQLNPPPLRKITDFKSKLTGGGARSNLFECELAFPQAVNVEGLNDILNKARFLVKAANLPASNVAPIEVPFRGRVLKIAGDRTFDTWTITVINDTDFAIRSAFEKWMNTINRVSDNTEQLIQQIIKQMHLYSNLIVVEKHLESISSMMYSLHRLHQLNYLMMLKAFKSFRSNFKFYTGKQLKVMVLMQVERTLTNRLNSAIIEVIILYYV